MSKENEQKLYQAKGIVSLTECFFDRGEAITKYEAEILQQSLAAAAALIAQVLQKE